MFLRALMWGLILAPGGALLVLAIHWTVDNPRFWQWRMHRHLALAKAACLRKHRASLSYT